MAEIMPTREHCSDGDLEYRVDWEDNRDMPRSRYFKTKKVAERFAVDIEVRVLGELLTAI